MLKALIDTILILILLGGSASMLAGSMRMEARTKVLAQTAVQRQAETTELRLAAP